MRRRHIPPQTRDDPFSNKLEADYAARLDLMLGAREIIEWRYEHVKFRLAKKTWYTPDFMVTYADRIEFHEVKGFWEDDARVKWKACADLYPEYGWVAVRRAKKGAGWQFEVYST